MSELRTEIANALPVWLEPEERRSMADAVLDVLRARNVSTLAHHITLYVGHNEGDERD